MAEQKSEVVETKTMSVWFDTDHGITMVACKDRCEIDLEDAKRSTDAILRVTGGEVRPALVDFANIKSQSSESRKYLSKDPSHTKTYSAVAIVVDNPVARVIANFFLGINRPTKPTKLFDDKVQAIEWLKQF